MVGQRDLSACSYGGHEPRHRSLQPGPIPITPALAAKTAAAMHDMTTAGQPPAPPQEGHSPPANKKLAAAPESLRPVATALEALMGQSLPVLDHGFIRVVDYMGNDDAIVQAARVSYGRGTRKASEDETLIRYLMRHWHTTPFEMCEIKLHIKLPIFVARQWIRHRTASVNEYSARYSIMDKEFYIPEIGNLAAQSQLNRQGRQEILDSAEAARVLQILNDDARRAFASYEEMLNIDQDGLRRDPQRLGLARELARINLTLNTYTQWYWKTDLHNLMHFLKLRTDSHAQYEIRAYAGILLMIVDAWVPMAAAAFREYRLDAVSFSRTALSVLRRMLAGESVTEDTSGLGRREWAELIAVISAE